MNPVEAKMAELSTRFAARARDERERLAASLAADDRAALRDQAHKLAGIAPMFGHTGIGDAALALETATEDGSDLAPPAARLNALLAALAG